MIWPDGYLGPDQWTDAGFMENPEDFPPEKSENWITEEQGEAVKDFVAAGNGFYSLHCNALVSNSSKNYRDVQGGGVLYHPNPQSATGYPALRPFKVHVVNKEHPVTQGVEDFMVTDEQYFTIYDKDPKNILLHGENLDGLTFAPDYGVRGQRGPENQAAGGGAFHTLGTVSTSGWAHEYGKGRVVFTDGRHNPLDVAAGTSEDAEECGSLAVEGDVTKAVVHIAYEGGLLKAMAVTSGIREEVTSSMKRADGISRRTLLRNAGVAAAVGALGGLETRATSQHPQRNLAERWKPRTLALIGDRYHDQDYIRVGLIGFSRNLTFQ